MKVPSPAVKAAVEAELGSGFLELLEATRKLCAIVGQEMTWADRDKGFDEWLTCNHRIENIDAVRARLNRIEAAENEKAIRMEVQP